MNRDAQLIQQFQSGDPEAFAELVRRYQNFVASLAYSATGDFSRSEDIAQQAFLTAWQRHKELDDPRCWTGWLRGIVRNLLRNAWRRAATEQRHQQYLQQQSAVIDDTSPLDECLDRERAALVWSVLEQIPEAYREPLVLYYREGKSVRAVANLLDISEDTVKQRLARGCRLMKAEIESTVEDALFESRPSDKLTRGVLAGLSATGQQTALKTAGSLTSAAESASWLSLVAGPLVGVAGAVFGCWMSLNSTQSARERAYVWRTIAWAVGLVICLLAGQLLFATVFPQSFARPVFHVTFWGAYLTILLLLIRRWNEQLIRIRIEENATIDASPEAAVATQAQIRQLEPVSKFALRANAVAAVGGTLAGPLILAPLAGDWPSLVGLMIAAVAIIAIAWKMAPRCSSVPGQLRFNGLVVLTTCLLLAVAICLRWHVWGDALSTIGLPRLSGASLSVIVVVIGAAVCGLAFRKAAGFAGTQVGQDGNSVRRDET